MNKPKAPGRRPMPEREKRVKVSITISPEAYEFAEEAGLNISRVTDEALLAKKRRAKS